MTHRLPLILLAIIRCGCAIIHLVRWDLSTSPLLLMRLLLFVGWWCLVKVNACQSLENRLKGRLYLNERTRPSLCLSLLTRGEFGTHLYFNDFATRLHTWYKQNKFRPRQTGNNVSTEKITLRWLQLWYAAQNKHSSLIGWYYFLVPPSAEKIDERTSSRLVAHPLIYGRG